MTTVLLRFCGGPVDGFVHRVDTREHKTGRPIIRYTSTGKTKFTRGYYMSRGSWNGWEPRVDLEWFYGAPVVATQK